MTKRLIEKYVQVVRMDGLNTKKAVDFSAAPTVALPSGTTIGGSPVAGATVPMILTGADANAIAVGPNGSTNPSFQVDDSASSAATGLKVTSAAAASGVAIDVISSGTNETLNLNAKGTGGVNLNTGTGTGTVAVGRSLTVGSAGAGLFRVTSANAAAIAVGPSGGTNPSFVVDASTASAVTGLSVKSAATGNGLAVSLISSGSNESLTVAAKGTGTITFNPAVTATAGGASNDGIMFGSIGVGLFTGTGAPTFSAMNGSIYVDSAATTTTTRIYVNKSGAGTAGTTWTNLTTAA